MKKLMVLVMCVIAMTTCLVGCGESSDETIRVGMSLTFSPFTGVDSDGNPAGIEVELAEAFGEYIGKKVEIVNTSFPMFATALSTGDVDCIIGSMAVTESRKETMDFSNAYFYNKMTVVIGKEYAESVGINDDMTEEEFFALPETRFTGLAGSIAVSVPESYGYQVESGSDASLSLLDIVNKDADAMVGVWSAIIDHNAYPDDTIIYNGLTGYTETAGAVLKGHNAELLESLNMFISTLNDEGGFFDSVKEKYDPLIKDFLNDNYDLDFFTKKPSLV